MRILVLRLLPLVTLLSAACTKKSTTTPPLSDPVATAITLSPTSLTLTSLGESAALTATVLDQNGVAMSTATVAWSSSTTSVASVSVVGVVTAVANGAVNVVATSGVATATAPVSVEQAADSIAASTTSVQLSSVSDTLRVSAVVFDAGGSVMVNAPLVWMSSDAAIATVSPEGVITAVGVGNATVVATSGTATVSIPVTVALAVASEIVFTSFRDGDYEIYVMNSDGSNQANLTNAAASADWNGMAEPGGGRVVAFTSDRDGNWEIYTVDRDGPGAPPENLTNDPRRDADPAWSWDASKIAFAREDTIWVMDPDGSNAVSLGVEGRHPTWSPDGSRLAFLRGPIQFPTAQTSPGALYVMDADGSNQVNVSPGSGSQDRTPEWSPDGANIVFNTRFGASGGTLVYTIGPDGSNLVTVEGTGALSVGWATWSPSGGQIAYSGPAAGSNDYEVWIMNADGSGNGQITSVAGTDFFPRWIR
jgi:Bacterial Ig-like domain (group 2)/WD40-like Beta Propeller Repeat